MYLSAHTLTARLGTRGRFAKEKGIQNKKKERMVMDERTGEWAPRWGREWAPRLMAHRRVPCLQYLWRRVRIRQDH